MISKPIFTREKLIELKKTNPKRFEELREELLVAYKEDRIISEHDRKWFEEHTY